MFDGPSSFGSSKRNEGACWGEPPAHRLRFHKVGEDGSGKCDAEETGDPEDRVIGVVYAISASEKLVLAQTNEIHSTICDNRRTGEL